MVLQEHQVLPEQMGQADLQELQELQEQPVQLVIQELDLPGWVDGPEEQLPLFLMDTMT